MAGRLPGRQRTPTYTGRTSRGFREETRDEYRDRLDRDATPFLGKMLLSDITAADIRALVRHVAARGVSQSTWGWRLRR